MAPQYVKPYVKRHKNDRADAEAICEAVQRKRGRRQTLRGGSLRARLNGPARVDAWRLGCRKVMADQAAGAAV
jgi:transposase